MLKNKNIGRFVKKEENNQKNEYKNRKIENYEEELVSCSKDKLIKIWNMKTGECKKILKAILTLLIH